MNTLFSKCFGPGAENFTGIYENTAIFDKIKKLLNL